MCRQCATHAIHQQNHPGRYGTSIAEDIQAGRIKEKEWEVKGQWFQSEKEAAEYAKTASGMMDGLFTVMFQGVEPVSEFKGGKRYIVNV